MKPITKTIPASTAYQYDLAGIYLAVMECTGDLTVTTSAGEVTEMRSGLNWYPERPFQWIRFQNDQAVDVTVKWQSGMDRIIDNSAAITVNSHPVTQDPASDPWLTQDANLRQKDSLSGSSAAVTNAAAVLLVAAGTAGKARDVDVRPVGGDVWIADDNAVGAANGKLVKDSEVCSLVGYIGAVYAIAVSTAATVYFDTAERA